MTRCEHDWRTDMGFQFATGDPLYYGLEGEPICSECWQALLADLDARRVDLTTLGDIQVSTVWLGLDHGMRDGAPPMIFETMVFGGALDQQDCWRYSTWAEAKRGHQEVVELVRLELAATDPATTDPRTADHE